MLTDKIKHYRTDAEYYDYFSRENPVIVDEERRRMQFLKRQIDFAPGAVIADCGSGNGWIAGEFLQRGVNVISIDLSEINLQRIQKIHDPERKGMYVIADLYNLPFKDGVLDGATSNDVFEHIEKPDQAAAEANRCLKPGGKFYVSVPYKENIIYYICIHCNKPTPINAHLHSFDDESLHQIFEQTGYKIERMKKFINKALTITLISYIFLRWMPYWLWRPIDKFVGLFIHRYSRISLTVVRANG